MPVVSPYSDGKPLVATCLLELGADGSVHEVAAQEAGVPVYAASTLKAAVMVAVHRAVDAGRLSLADRVVVRRRFASGVEGGDEFGFGDPDDRDPGLPQDGAEATLAQLVHRMIVVSSNEATNLVLEVVGFEAVAEALAACGCTDSRVERLIGDLAARAAGLSHVTTARDLARILAAIGTGRAASAEACALMRDTLRAQEFPEIGTVLPTGTRWGSKSGWVDGILHDVALVEPDVGCAWVLAVCTRGYEEAQARTAIRALAAQTWALRRA